MSKLVLHGRFGAVEGQRDALVKNLLRAAQDLEEFTACRLYVVSTSESDPNGVWVTEIWDSPEDHAASLKLPGTRELITETLPLIAEMQRDAPRLSLVGGKGAPR